MDRGAVVGDRFEILELAGTGGMGAVYRAHDRVSDEEVALKVMVAAHPAQAERFGREAAVLAELAHPAIVRYVAHGRSGLGELYLAMEWLDGEDLATRLARKGMSVEETVQLGARVAEALALAHGRGVIHRDVKPANLFLPLGRIDETKVLDFGVARLADGRVATGTGVLVGTPGYAAPEQARGLRDLDARADVFALGCVLFECLTGRAAFVGDNPMAVLAKILLEEAPRPREVRPEVPAALDDLVARMMAKDPLDRPADVGAIGRALLTLGASGGQAPAGTVWRPQSITGGEQRLLCVIVAGGRGGAIHDDAVAPTLAPDEIAAHDGARKTALEYGARLERLADGTLVATLTGQGSATDLAARAARAALAIHERLPESPMAVATGRGVVARWPVGEAIDRATRLLARAKGAPLLVDEVTAGLLDARFDLAPHAAGVELLGLRGSEGGGRTLLGKPTPCLGRDRELITLRAVYDECALESVARAVLLTGPAGIGKSRVRQELLRQLERRSGPHPAEVWLGVGDPISAGSPFGMLGQLVRRAAGIVDGEPLPLRRDKLRARVAGRVPAADAPRVAEFLGEIAGAPFPDEESVQLRAARADAMTMGDQMRRAFLDWLRGESASRPILLVLEDLQWGDLPTVRFVEAALRDLADRPLMVLALARPEVRDVFPQLWAERGLHEIRLGELSRKAAERLTREALGERATPELTARLVERAGGNAFFLEELIRAAADGKEEAPGTVLAMVQARLESLDPGARRLLRAASVFGQVFWRGGVVALLGGARAGSVDDWLAALVDREVIARRSEGKFPGETEYAMRHALVREAAYAMLTDGDRALGHRLAGEWLERQGDHEAQLLAEHFERGGEGARAAGWWRQAAEEALRGDDLAAAIARCERGCASGAEGELRGHLRWLQADASAWLGNFADAVRCDLEAIALLPPGGAHWCKAAAEAVTLSGMLGDYARAAELVMALRAVTPTEEAVPAYCRAVAGLLYLFLMVGQYELMVDFLERLEDAAARGSPDDPTLAGWVGYARMLSSLWLRCDPWGALGHATASGRAFERAGDQRGAALANMWEAFGLLELGAFERAEARFAVALQAMERHKLKQLAAAAGRPYAVTKALLGKLDEARVEMACALHLSTGSDAMVAVGRAFAARLFAMLGDRAGAEREGRAAVAALTSMTPPLRAMALAALAEVLIADGRGAEALPFAAEAREILDALTTIGENDARVRLAHAEALHAAGAAPAARSAIAAARDRLLRRASLIADDELRQSFLERVPENARTLSLARAWAD